MAAAVAPPEAQSWRDTRVGGDSSVPTAWCSPPFSPLFPLCGVAWPPVVFLGMSRNDALAGDGRVGKACQGLSLSSSSPLPGSRSIAGRKVLTEPVPRGEQEGSRLGPAGWHPGPPLHLALWCACTCVSIYRWPSACWCRRSCRLHACVCREPRKVLCACAAVCSVRHTRPDLTRCHSWYNGAKEQCGTLFLSERKNERTVCLRLGAPGMGWVLLGTHPPACPAFCRVQQLTAPSPGTSGPVCPGGPRRLTS